MEYMGGKLNLSPSLVEGFSDLSHPAPFIKLHYLATNNHANNPA